VLNIPPAQLRNGLVTSSTGNAALAFVYACSVTGARTAPSMIFLPTTASEAKVSRLRAQGALLRQHGADCVVAEVEARRVAQERGWTYISPYNDAQVCVWSWGCGCVLRGWGHSSTPVGTIENTRACAWHHTTHTHTQVMAGQGTLAVELLQQLPDGFDVAIVPVGGGGLIAGVAAVLKSVSRHIQVRCVRALARAARRPAVALSTHRLAARAVCAAGHRCAAGRQRRHAAVCGRRAHRAGGLRAGHAVRRDRRRGGWGRARLRLQLHSACAGRRVRVRVRVQRAGGRPGRPH
jgi:threonine dehydratase